MPRLSRRAFVLGIVATLIPIRATAQATPETQPTIDMSGVEGITNAETRAFVRADLGLADLFTGELIKVDAGALSFVSSRLATEALDVLPERAQRFVEEIVRTDPNYAGSDVAMRDVSTGSLGDDAAAMSITIQGGDDTPLASYSYAVTLIRQEEIVQVIVGQSAAGAMSSTLAIAESTLDRWPSDTLSDALPTLDDMPPGMTEIN